LYCFYLRTSVAFINKIIIIIIIIIIVVSCLNYCILFVKLHHLLPPTHSMSYLLRQCGHFYELLNTNIRKLSAVI